jgi:hypothetical protein
MAFPYWNKYRFNFPLKHNINPSWQERSIHRMQQGPITVCDPYLGPHS